MVTFLWSYHPFCVIQSIVLFFPCSSLSVFTYVWLLGSIFEKRFFNMCLLSCQGLTVNAMSLGDIIPTGEVK